MIFLKPTTDIAFKKLFANKEHSNVLISFLNSVLNRAEGEKIVTVTINDPHNLPETEQLKVSAVDVRCEDQSGKRYIVEMQVTDQDNFTKRALYYTSIAYSRQLKGTYNYRTLLPVIFVGILDFNLFKNPHYLTHHLILDTATKEQTFFDQEFHFVELRKFTKQLDELVDDADKWIYLLKNAQMLEEVPAQFSVAPAMQEAFTILEQGKWTVEELDTYQRVMDAAISQEIYLETALARGEAQGMARGMKKGMEQGMEEGQLKKARAIAQELLDVLDIETISKKTGLSIEEVEQLKKQ